MSIHPHEGSGIPIKAPDTPTVARDWRALRRHAAAILRQCDHHTRITAEGGEDDARAVIAWHKGREGVGRFGG